MRLINTLDFRPYEFFGDQIPKYAILSHTWGAGELTFQGMLNPTGTVQKKSGYQKMVRFVQESGRLGHEYAWIDTCCIDKTSSAELTEAINSMFSWYQRSEVCLVILEDVQACSGDLLAQLENSRWFTRGWTLQELVGSKYISFYDRSWESFLVPNEWLSKITRIPERVLNEGLTEDISVAQKMSWASRRRTTREEDIAYCLMGLFDVNMPLLYGEGPKAFFRLQEELVKKSTDHTLFLWQDRDSADTAVRGIFARHPSEFEECGRIVTERGYGGVMRPYTLTNAGLQTSLSVLPLTDRDARVQLCGPRESYLVENLTQLKDLTLAEPGRLFVPYLSVAFERRADTKFDGYIPAIVLRQLGYQRRHGGTYARVLARHPLKLGGFTNMNVKKFGRLEDERASLPYKHPPLYLLSTVRLLDLPPNPISGYRFVRESNREDERDLYYDILSNEDCNGLSVWGNDILRPIPRSLTARAIACLSLRSGEKEYLIFELSYRSLLASSMERFCPVSVASSRKEPDKNDVLRVPREDLQNARMSWPFSRRAIYKDQLVVELPITSHLLESLNVIFGGSREIEWKAIAAYGPQVYQVPP